MSLKGDEICFKKREFPECIECGYAAWVSGRQEESRAVICPTLRSCSESLGWDSLKNITWQSPSFCVVRACSL